MERPFIDQAELDLRRDSDFLDSLNMVGEGAPVHCPVYECKLVTKQLETIERMKGYQRTARQCG